MAGVYCENRRNRMFLRSLRDEFMRFSQYTPAVGDAIRADTAQFLDPQELERYSAQRVKSAIFPIFSIDCPCY